MKEKETEEMIRGISVSNPVEVKKEYLLHTVDYAIKHNLNHIQFIGPIHNPVKGNLDGMILYRKYSQFNEGKNLPYIMQAADAIHAACKRAKLHGIKTYVWHHELELPHNFNEVYPECTNSGGDIEVTHPRVKDFLEHKIKDFFHAYSDMHGIILTLHETNVPLLKLKDQKLDKIDRVKYVTQILFEACRALGKELIVRPFASIEQDYEMMTKAYEEVSCDMMIMDKWTQFDWSLTLPHNAFFKKIKKNPLLVEGDVFGEYFGKGHLPIMLRRHLAEKFSYCEDFSPRGYVARIDRGGYHPFGSVNEVNLAITAAYMNQEDPDAAIDMFFQEKYPQAAEEVKALMEETEDVMRQIFYLNGYYFSELSYFPALNHCKNHFYFEMMRENYDIASDEWFIPRNWSRGTLNELLVEKSKGASKAGELFERLLALKSRIDKQQYQKLWVKFCNLKYAAEIWEVLTQLFIDYVQYFETRSETHELDLHQHLALLLEKNKQGKELLGEQFFCAIHEGKPEQRPVEDFYEILLQNFELEKKAYSVMEDQEDTLDFVICGGGTEGHRLQKEVNFSDTMIHQGSICRIPGSLRGRGWCSVNAHGWFSYEIEVTPNAENQIEIEMGSLDETLDVSVDIAGENHVVQDCTEAKQTYRFIYTERKGEDRVRIGFHKMSATLPCIFTIKVRK